MWMPKCRISRHFPHEYYKKIFTANSGRLHIIHIFPDANHEITSDSVTEFPEILASRGILTVRRPGVVSADGNIILSEALRFYAF